MTANEAEQLSIIANKQTIDHILSLIEIEAKKGNTQLYVPKKVDFNDIVIRAIKGKGFSLNTSRSNRMIYW
jgi:hypothetical protein